MKEYLPKIIVSIIVLVVFPVSRYLMLKLMGKSGHIMQMQEARILQLKRVVSILLNVVFILTLAITWGVDPDNILVGLSSVFAVIGVAFFAQWSVLSNITAGIIMFFTAPFRIGDRIQIVDKDIPGTAVIENIQTFYTHIRTEDDELIVIPNNLFLQKAVLVKGRSK